MGSDGTDHFERVMLCSMCGGNVKKYFNTEMQKMRSDGTKHLDRVTLCNMCRGDVEETIDFKIRI